MSRLSHLSTAELTQLQSLMKSYKLKDNLKRRKDIVEKNMDFKHAYHVCRLLLEVEQIMSEGDLNLECNSDILKSIRRGEWSLEKLDQWFDNKEKALELMYSTSTLQHKPNEQKIKGLLMECLEMHYGSLSAVIHVEPSMSNLLSDMQVLLDKYTN
jgi:hypothetical protein